MSNCVGLLFAISLVFLKEIGFSAADDSCNSNSDCPYYYGCCRGFGSHSDRSCRLAGKLGSCRGYFCLSNRDCNGQGECCVSNTCTVNCPSCSSIRDCESGKYCCFTKNNVQNRCDVNCLGKYCSNKWSCGGLQECCRSNVCVNCSTPGCRSHHECRERQYCCKNEEFQGGNVCRTSCVGATCTADADCAGNSECCHSNKCVTCASLECSSNSECGDAYCCGRRFFETSRCAWSNCIGQNCDKSSDCGGRNECCRGNKCVNCSESECKDNSECPAGEYCCKGEGQAVCRQSCIGRFCHSNEGCSAPGECCINNYCTALNCSCRSKSDCRNGQYCCRSLDKNDHCSTNCTGIRCISDNDCSPGEGCTYPDVDCIYKSSDESCRKRPVRRCFSSNGCYSHNDCNIFGSGYYCCKNTRIFAILSCRSTCINEFCNEDNDCGGSGECCDRKKKKCVDCPNDFPVWAIVVIVLGVLVVILVCGYVYCRVCRIRVRLPRPSQPSPTVPQEMQGMPSRSTETEHGNGQFNVRNTNEEYATVLPSAPPLIEPYPSTLTLPPPPSYESLFQKR